MIKFKCSKCGNSLKVKGRSAGKRGSCPACGKSLQIPEHSADAGRNTKKKHVPDSAGNADSKSKKKPAEQRSGTNDILNEMSADDSSRILDVGEELLPEQKTDNKNAFLAVSGTVAALGLIIFLLNIGTFHHLNTLFAFQQYESLEALTEDLQPLGLVGAAVQIGMILSALLMFSGGLIGLAMHNKARNTMIAGLLLLVAIQLAHAGSGFVEQFEGYTGEAGGANLPLAGVLILLGFGTLFYLRGASDIADDSETDQFVNIQNLVDRIFQKAHECRASDVHIEPSRDGAVVRFRIDGILHTAVTYPMHAMDRIISRIKVMAGMDIAEKHLPQDGGTSMILGGKTVDLRISTVPSQLGERAVIRILDQNTELLSLKSLGMGQKLLKQMHRIVQQPHGMFFCTGPTGSGKTTTLYAALLHINFGERNVMTVEDPVEYHLKGIAQLPISKQKGMTFAEGMRSLLRQDPDVIMVGEVRDRETARMAVEAAQTGHLVLSTLHTNDAAGAVSRLLDLQVEPYMLASTRTAALAQRLVRRICADCREPYKPSSRELASLGIKPEKTPEYLYHGTGCNTCMNTGYFGRVGIYELLVLNDTIREMITKRADAGSIRKAAVKSGMVSLKEEGARKVIAGLTTIAEIRRVTHNINIDQ